MSYSFPAPQGLDALNARVLQDIAWLDLPAKPWVIPKTHKQQTVLDVAIIGGGMAGLAASAALKLLGIQATIFDKAPKGFEGPWVTTARMETLRSPKQLAGPALGIGSLTFRAWFEAQFGQQAWEDLDKIPRTQWMDYLRWYRQVLDLPLLNEHEVVRVLPLPNQLVELSLNTPEGKKTYYARRVVLATGRDGLGGATVPEIANTLPRHLWAHSSHTIDFTRLKGKRVGVVGAGASAMDSAATALEAGAHSVDLIIRRTDIPRVNKAKGAGNPGITYGHADLPDHWKWAVRHYINASQVPPPRGSTLRVSRHPNARFNLGCPMQAIEVIDDTLHVQTPKGTFVLDFLIFSTGFRIDWLSRPEYADLAPHVRSWGDRYSPPEGEFDQELHDSPDLGPYFELQEKTPGSCPEITQVHCFCYPAALSHGAISGDIPAISDGARKLSQGIASLLYQEDVAEHYARLQAYDEPEVFGDEWTPAPPPQALNPSPVDQG